MGLNAYEEFTKKKMKTVDAKTLIKLKKWWSILRLIEDGFWEEIHETEQKMIEDTGIKDIEFFFGDEDFGAKGIGNASRTIALIHRQDLE